MKKLDKKEFIARAIEKHKSKYTYKNVTYTKRTEKVSITCPIHGDFQQTPANHLGGQGCPECAKIERWDTRGRMTFENFKERAIEKHGERYTYSKTEINGNATMMTIICPEHGEFQQRASSHIAGAGCPKCAGNIRKTTEEFICEAKNTHNEFYDYSKTNYTSAFKKVVITCPIHGDFEQTPDNYLNGRQGCPYCGSSGIYNRAFFDNNPHLIDIMATLYLLEFSKNNEKYIKIGITKKGISKRFPENKRSGYKISTIKELDMRLYDAWVIEQDILSTFRLNKAVLEDSFSGHTEILEYFIKDDIVSRLNEAMIMRGLM